MSERIQNWRLGVYRHPGFWLILSLLVGLAIGLWASNQDWVFIMPDEQRETAYQTDVDHSQQTDKHDCIVILPRVFEVMDNPYLRDMRAYHGDAIVDVAIDELCSRMVPYTLPRWRKD